MFQFFDSVPFVVHPNREHTCVRDKSGGCSSPAKCQRTCVKRTGAICLNYTSHIAITSVMCYNDMPRVHRHCDIVTDRCKRLLRQRIYMEITRATDHLLFVTRVDKVLYDNDDRDSNYKYLCITRL